MRENAISGFVFATLPASGDDVTAFKMNPN